MARTLKKKRFLLEMVLCKRLAQSLVFLTTPYGYFDQTKLKKSK